ncbi:MAG: hypothetical protein ACRDRT_00115 [Pseudonocardiaceae bacterium]
MIPLAVLVLASLGLRLIGFAGVGALDAWQPALRAGLAAMLVLTASAHFASRRAELIAFITDGCDCHFSGAATVNFPIA